MEIFIHRAETGNPLDKMRENAHVYPVIPFGLVF